MKRIVAIVSILLMFTALSGGEPAEAGLWSDFKEKVKSIYDRIASGVRETGEEVKESSITFGKDFSEAARNAGEQVKNDASDLGHSASEGVKAAGTDIKEAFGKMRKKFDY